MYVCELCRPRFDGAKARVEFYQFEMSIQCIVTLDVEWTNCLYLYCT